jgi:hypothetical protein
VCNENVINPPNRYNRGKKGWLREKDLNDGEGEEGG